MEINLTGFLLVTGCGALLCILWFFLSRRAGFTGNPLLMIMGVLSMACIIVTCLMQGREANV